MMDVKSVPSSYLKAMQLTKQLEEKAKEATRNRQQAEEELGTTKKLIESAKSTDINTSKSEDLYGQANAAFDGKEYKNALALVTLARGVMEKSFGDYALDIINSTSSLLDLVIEIGGTSETANSNLASAKKIIEEKDFEKAISMAKQTWADLEKIILEHMSQAFSSAQSMIVLARNSGDDVSSAETHLADAREAINQQEYQSALQYLRECRKTVDSGISLQIEELSDEAKGYLITAKELKADVSRIEELLEKIDEEQTLGELEKALSSSRLCKSEAEKTLNKALSDAIELQMSAIEKATEINAETAKAKEIINRSRIALKNGNYSETHTALNEAEEEIQNSQFQKVLKTISKSRSKFLKAKKFGAQLDEAIDYLNKAKESLKDGDYANALEMAEKGDVVVDGIIKDFAELDDLIMAMEENLAEARETGIDVSNSEELVNQAKEAIDSKDPANGMQLIEKAKSMLEDAQYSFVAERIEMAELVISAGDNLGAILDEPNEMMHNAISSVKDGDFKLSLKEAERSISRAEEIIKIHVSNTISTAELALGEAEGVDVDEINRLISLARQSFDMNAFDEAYVHADKALGMMETVQSTKAKEVMAVMYESMKIAREMGCDVTGLEDSVAECNESIKNRDFFTALELADKVNKEAVSLQFTISEKEFGAAKLSVIEAKKLGIDITDMRDDLKMAKVAFDKKKYRITFKKSEEARSKAVKIIAKHGDAYESMTQAAAMVAEAKKNQLDVTAVMETLVQAKSSFESADYDNAKELAENVKKDTENLMHLYSASDKIQNVSEYINVLESLDVDIAEANKMVDETKEALSKKEYDNATTLAERTERDVLDLLKSSITNLISSAESAIMDAKEVGINVSSPSEQLESSKRGLADLKFKEAIEFANSAKAEVEAIKELSQKAATAFKELQDSLTDLEGFHANLDEAKALQNDAMTALRNNEHEKAIEFSERCLETANNAVEKHVETTIDDFGKAIEKAKNDGATVTSSEKLIVDARAAFDSKDFITAIELAMRSEGELEKVSLQQDMAAKAIDTAEGKLKDAEALGIHSRQARSLLDLANRDIKSGDYVKALEHAIQSGDELYRAREEFRTAEESMDLLKGQIDTAVEIGTEISIAKNLFSDAESAMNGNDYNTAQEIAKEGLIEARRISYSHLNTKISNAYKLIDLTNKLNIGASGMSPILAEAKTFLDTGKFKVSNEKINLCVDDLNNKLETHIKDYITNSETATAHAKEVGADVSESERLLKEARTKLEYKQFEDALALAKKSMSGVGDLKRGIEKEFIELTYKANTIISTATKFGINVKEAEGLFNIAKEKQSTDYKTAINILNNSISLAQSKLDDFRPRLKADIVADRVVKGQWVETDLIVTNVGKTLGNNINIRIIGDIEQEGSTTLDKIKGGGEELRIPIKIKLNAQGEIPVILEITSHRLLDNQRFVDKVTDNIFVSEEKAVARTADATFETVKAESDVKCNVCMGTVKKGTGTIKCSCGNTYHETCGTRFGKCTKCSNEFTTKLEKDAETEVLKDLGESPAPSTPSTQPVKEEDEKKKPKKRLSFKV